jgi:lysophospholipase L1-like esterase
VTPRVALVLAIVSGAILAAAAYLARLRLQHGHNIQAREVAILSQARQGMFPVVIMGDSIVERANISTLCGRKALNAGVPGATVKDLLDFAPQLMAAIHPRLIIIAAGVNDAHVGGQTDPTTFRNEYARLIECAKRTTAAVAISDIVPVGAPYHPRALIYDPAHIARLNQALATLDASLIEVSKAMARLGEPLPDVYTDDGVHPNAAGYVRWRQAIATACAGPGQNPSYFSPPSPKP